MPAARNQEVTVRQLRAKRTPASSKGSRAAVRLSSQWPRQAKTLVSRGGKYDNVMAGSLQGDLVNKGYPVRGAGLCPNTCLVHYFMPRQLPSSHAISSG